MKNVRMSLFPLEDMVAEAIAFMQENEPAEGYYLGFSGGKDSIVLRHLAHMANVRFWAYHSLTRIDPPEVIKHMRKHYPDVSFLYPEKTFWEAIKEKSPPLRTQRWCCDVLKKDPGKKIPLKHRLMGVRKEESKARAARERISAFQGQITYKPIFDWTEWHIWAFIEKYNLPYPSLYDEGFDRIGCVICPFILHGYPLAQKRLKRNMERWPGIFKTFEKVTEKWFNERIVANGGKRKNQHCDTFESYIQGYYMGFEDKSGRPLNKKKLEGFLDQGLLDPALASDHREAAPRPSTKQRKACPKKVPPVKAEQTRMEKK